MPAAVTDWQTALERDVRANPAYRLRPVASLSLAQRRSLVQLGVDVSKMAGVLVEESGSALPDKLVDGAAAELFAVLQRPARLQSLAAGRLAELVLDGVLEIESSTGFVCGPVAYEWVMGSPPQPPIAQTPPDRLSRLSHAALAYAQRLHLPDVDAIAARLYCYHRVPLSARWARAFPGPSAVLGLLREPVLTRHWVGAGDESADEYWLSWTRKARRSAAGPGELPYKLYVSPCVEDLAEAVPAFVDALSSTTAQRFKIGSDATGLLRPD